MNKKTRGSRFAALLTVIALVFGSFIATSPAQAATGSLVAPFDQGQTWYICQGYNQPNVTHHDGQSAKSRYGLDLVAGSGCNTTASTGLNVRAPMAGTVSWSSSSGSLCINTTDGRSITLTHISASVTSGSVSAGQVVGTVAGPSASSPPYNGGVAHIHLQMWSSPGCWGTGNGGIPFDDAHGARICGAPNLYSGGPWGGNGEWSGTSFSNDNCTGTVSPYVVSVPKSVAYMIGSAQYIDVYAVASDHQIYRKNWNGWTWNAPVAIGGAFERDPSVVTYTVGGTTYVDVFALSSNSNIYRRTLNATTDTWTTPGFVPIGCCFWSDPSAVVAYTSGGTVYVDVYATASNGHMYNRVWNATTGAWTTPGFDDRGCCFTNRAPTVVSYIVGSATYVDVYTLASNGNIYRTQWNGSGWSSPTALGCCFVSDPTVVAYAVGSTSYVDVYALGSGGNIYRNTWNGSGWSQGWGWGPGDIGCCFWSKPSAVTYMVGSTAYVDVYATASNGYMYRNTWNGSGWSYGSSWTSGSLGCCFTTNAPTPVTYIVGSTPYIDLYSVASNTILYRRFWDGSTWSGSGFGYLECCFDHLS